MRSSRRISIDYQTENSDITYGLFYHRECHSYFLRSQICSFHTNIYGVYLVRIIYILLNIFS